MNEIYKDAIYTSKRNKKGKLSLVKEDGVFKTIPQNADVEDLLIPVFRNGQVIKEYTFEEVRENTEKL